VQTVDVMVMVLWFSACCLCACFQYRCLLIIAFLVDVRQSDVTSSYGAMTSYPPSTDGGGVHLCRDRYGAVNVTTFARRACALCFSFMFQRAKHVGLAAEPPHFLRLVRLNASGAVYADPILVRDPDDDLNFTRQVCAVLGNWWSILNYCTLLQLTIAATVAAFITWFHMTLVYKVSGVNVDPTVLAGLTEIWGCLPVNCWSWSFKERSFILYLYV